MQNLLTEGQQFKKILQGNDLLVTLIKKIALVLLIQKINAQSFISTADKKLGKFNNLSCKTVREYTHA